MLAGRCWAGSDEMTHEQSDEEYERKSAEKAAAATREREKEMMRMSNLHTILQFVTRISFFPLSF